MVTKPKKAATYYKVNFAMNNEAYQLCAESVSTADWPGLIEIGGFIFPQSSLLHNPGEERLKKEFASVKKIWVPYHSIIRIDEVYANDDQHETAKIVPLHEVKEKSGSSAEKSSIITYP